MTKAKIEEIALEILDYLATVEEGTELTTWEAADAVYGRIFNNGNYAIKGEEMDELELMDIDYAIRKNARKKGLKLDSSKYDGMVIGLPYNIGYVITRCRKKTTSQN